VTKKTISPKDSELFRQTVGDVRAVNNDKVEFKQARLKPYPKPQAYDLDTVWRSSVDLEIDSVSHEETLSYTAPGIQKSVLAKLRKGFFKIQGEIDLHGLTSEMAKTQLVEFLHDSVNSGYRCVHIIHGKGYRSSDNHPVLKNNINQWLRLHKEVQAFCSASPKQGGAGAIYVLLKQSLQFPEKYEE
jgi:DNA-nicking Smr family endonuclease